MFARLLEVLEPVSKFQSDRGVNIPKSKRRQHGHKSEPRGTNHESRRGMGRLHEWREGDRRVGWSTHEVRLVLGVVREKRAWFAWFAWFERVRVCVRVRVWIYDSVCA